MVDNSNSKTCFVIMPISDPSGYEEEHFRRVYKHLIRPACEKAGYNPMRADDVKNTNYIIVDILRRIINSDIVLCDLSSKNPNVLYELGVRQAFDLPVVLIRDSKTERIFDIQGLRTLEYNDKLRVDTVSRDIEQIVSTIRATTESSTEDINSLVKLLGTHKAELKEGTEISADASLILESIKDVSERLSKIEKLSPLYPSKSSTSAAVRITHRLPSGDDAEVGDGIYDSSTGTYIGTLQDVKDGKVLLLDENNELIIVSKRDNSYYKLSSIPF